MSLAARLTLAIERAGTTCYRLDLLLDVALARPKRVRGHVEKIARGDIANPSASLLAALAGMLGTSVEHLAAGIGDPPSERKARRAFAEALARFGGEHAAPLRAAR